MPGMLGNEATLVRFSNQKFPLQCTAGCFVISIGNGLQTLLRDDLKTELLD